MAKQYRNSGLRCSFCHKTQQEDGKLKIIAGPQNVFICSDCVRLCLEIIRENTQNRSFGFVFSPIFGEFPILKFWAKFKTWS